VSSNRFDPLDENEREWLRSSRRVRARRTWASLIGLAVVLGLVIWLVVALLPRTVGPGTRTPVATSPQDRLIADSRKALGDWGKFGVSGDLNAVKASFWTNGPQYKLLTTESPKLKRHPIGPPAYQFVLEDPVTVLRADKGQLVRGVVKSTRQGQQTRSFRWDIYMRQDPNGGGRWRLWTVASTPSS
jgi:hypothetical protein